MRANYTTTVGTTNAINGNYNGMVASLTKRVGDWHGFGTTFFTPAYTWSHLIDDGTGIFRNTSQVPYYNHHQFHGTGDNDVRNRFVFSGGWTMPWDKAWKGGPRWLTQGWTLYPIFVAQSGLTHGCERRSVSGWDARRIRCGRPGTPETELGRRCAEGLESAQIPDHRRPDGKFHLRSNGTHFARLLLHLPTGRHVVQNFNAPGTPGGCASATYGTLPRNFFRGPGRVNFDLALAKETSLFENKLQVTFRAEFFNILNHTEFQNPSGGPASFYSGQLGQVVSTFDQRIGQLSLRLAF